MNRRCRRNIGAGAGAVVFIIWLVCLFASIFVSIAIGAIAGDVLGLWEVVEFV